MWILNIFLLSALLAVSFTDCSFFSNSDFEYKSSFSHEIIPSGRSNSTHDNENGFYYFYPYPDVDLNEKLNESEVISEYSTVPARKVEAGGRVTLGIVFLIILRPWKGTLFIILKSLAVFAMLHEFIFYSGYVLKCSPLRIEKIEYDPEYGTSSFNRWLAVQLSWITGIILFVLLPYLNITEIASISFVILLELLYIWGVFSINNLSKSEDVRRNSSVIDFSDSVIC